MDRRHEALSDGNPLRRGWTTGACATAATKAAAIGLLTGTFPDPVRITLPKGQRPSFPLAFERSDGTVATCGIVKDGGDDPDVTHGATVISSVRKLSAAGVSFRAGEGVGTVTKAGLPVPVGEPAINPVPRRMISDILTEASSAVGYDGGWQVTISIPGGEEIAETTWNPRLGIVGGLSILGTTGIVNPYSCAAWIHSIHRGIDVARASGLEHVVGSTGSTSERVAQERFPSLPLHAYLDMGDFAGGLIKYIREHPIPRLTIAGGFAKLTKLAQGSLDLHSARSQIDLNFLAERMPVAYRDRVLNANTANEVLELWDREELARYVARKALRVIRSNLRDTTMQIDLLVSDRAGHEIAFVHEG